MLAVESDLNPADAPTLFGLGAGEGVASLLLYKQDPATQMWRSGTLQQPSSTVAEVVRFRTEISVFNEYGNPLPNQPVSVQVAENGSAIDLWVAGKVYPVSSTTGATLMTDAYGKLTMASLVTTGMATPDLVVSAPGLADSATVQPAGPMHAYLSGTGQLNPTNPGGALANFDAGGNTLTAAKVSQNGTEEQLAPALQQPPQLAPVAAQAIRSTAQVG